MNTEVLRVKHTDDTFEAIVDRDEGEAVIKYKGNVPDSLILAVDDFQKFANFINQIAKEESK